MEFVQKEHYTFEDLIALTRVLRAGCPWDSVQTHHSVRRNFIEEVYEACEAIDQEDTPHLREELGDVLYQVLFHSLMEEEAGHFDIYDVCDEICKKLVSRHPFLFAKETARDEEEALDRWDDVKRKLNGYETTAQAMNGVSRTLPALWRAEKLWGKAEKAGLQKSPEEVIAEMSKTLQALPQNPEALGTLLFQASVLSHTMGLDPEDALNAASEHFIADFAEKEKKHE